MKLLQGRIETICGDITRIPCDVLVNAANSSLLGGGGVDGAIHRAAGPALLRACRRVRNEEYPHGLPPGEAVLTEPGDLKLRGIIHTVGPVWTGGTAGEPGVLASCYRNCLALADLGQFKILAFPAISTGVYAYPPSLAAQTVYETLKSTLPTLKFPEKVLLVFFSSAGESTFLEAIRPLTNEMTAESIE
ncbi:macro domain-containing protein [Oceanispirochaeta sp.]|jgi:O-acetyl-ADP-ribose deacetylase (regulator of RNase III)|uniref:macro domain-containing protein n=1 Tax=Oceanispirochaeta sp. TaxID=2035350 RepID=UPI00261C0196|nr:macro domain-containing protein [Oceanispirochaeta sp.]MDA3956060.1 macro domain-containing protein [Oceanispirochaeta sp.]